MFTLGWFAQDLEIATRVLLRRVGFAATAIATLALALGTNIVIFTVTDRALLRPLPYREADRLVTVLHRDIAHARDDKATGAEVAEWRARRDVLSDVGFSWDAQYTLTSAAHPVTLRAFQLSASFFPMLGVRAELGRAFVAGDEAPGSDRAVVLSDHSWRSLFGGDSGIVDRTIRLDDEPYTVIGVMPARFAYPDRGIDLWTPLVPSPALARDRSLRIFNVVARLASGTTIARARAALGRNVAVEPLRDRMLGPAGPVLWVLEAAVLLLLAIATANVANLALVHAVNARHELALRRALGATGTRLFSQFLTLALLLSAVSLAAGVLLASYAMAAVPALLGQLAAVLPEESLRGPSLRSLGGACGIAIAIGLLFAIVMSLGGRAASAEALRGDARTGSTRHVDARVRDTAIALQVALAFVLLASSGLLVRSWLRLERRALGFATDDRITLILQPPSSRYAGLATMSAYVDRILERVRALPGVRSAVATSAIPLSGMDARRRLLLAGQRDSARENVVHYRVVSPAYTATMAIPLRRGRGLTPDDRAGAPQVALVNETLARARWPGEDPVGSEVTVVGGPAPETVRIVGVVGDVRHEGLAAEPQPELYRPLDQVYWPFFGIVVHYTGDAGTLTRGVEDAVWSVDPSQPIDRVSSMEYLAAESVALRRTTMLLLSGFALAALLLAAVGIYGVISYLVSLRTREIGVRLALGAAPGDVARQIVGTGTRLALAGALAGIAATLALTRYVASLLFAVRPSDPVTIVATLVMTIALAAVASFIPARRAAHIDPAIALRSE